MKFKAKESDVKRLYQGHNKIMLVAFDATVAIAFAINKMLITIWSQCLQINM